MARRALQPAGEASDDGGMGGPSNERRRKAQADRARKRDAGSSEQEALRASPRAFSARAHIFFVLKI